MCMVFRKGFFLCDRGKKKSKFHKSLFPVISPLFIFLQGLFHNVKFMMQELGSYVLIWNYTKFQFSVICSVFLDIDKTQESVSCNWYTTASQNVQNGNCV